MFNFFSELKTKFLNINQKLNPYQIIMIGDSLMYAEGKITLMTLSKENIVFKVEQVVIIVSGQNLTLKDLSQNSLTICGTICLWERV